MQENFKIRNIRRAYKELNFFCKDFRRTANMYKDATGNIVVGREDVNNRWREFSQLYLMGMKHRNI